MTYTKPMGYKVEMWPNITDIHIPNYLPYQLTYCLWNKLYSNWTLSNNTDNYRQPSSKKYIFDAYLKTNKKNRVVGNGKCNNLQHSRAHLTDFKQRFRLRAGASHTHQTPMYSLFSVSFGRVKSSAAVLNDPVLWTMSWKYMCFFIFTIAYLRETMGSAAYCKEQLSGDS